MDTIPSQMGRQRERAVSLDVYCKPSAMATRSQFLGLAEYVQNSLRQPATGLSPFQCLLCYLLCSHGPGNHWMLTIGSKRARGSGTEHTISFRGQCDAKKSKPMPSSSLPAQTEGLAVHQRHQNPPALQEA